MKYLIRKETVTEKINQIVEEYNRKYEKMESRGALKVITSDKEVENYKNVKGTDRSIRIFEDEAGYIWHPPVELLKLAQYENISFMISTIGNENLGKTLSGATLILHITDPLVYSDRYLLMASGHQVQID